MEEAFGFIYTKDEACKDRPDEIESSVVCEHSCFDMHLTMELTKPGAFANSLWYMYSMSFRERERGRGG